MRFDARGIVSRAVEFEVAWRLRRFGRRDGCAGFQGCGVFLAGDFPPRRFGFVFPGLLDGSDVDRTQRRGEDGNGPLRGLEGPDREVGEDVLDESGPDRRGRRPARDPPSEGSTAVVAQPDRRDDFGGEAYEPGIAGFVGGSRLSGRGPAQSASRTSRSGLDDTGEHIGHYPSRFGLHDGKRARFGIGELDRVSVGVGDPRDEDRLEAPSTGCEDAVGPSHLQRCHLTASEYDGHLARQARLEAEDVEIVAQWFDADGLGEAHCDRVHRLHEPLPKRDGAVILVLEVSRRPESPSPVGKGNGCIEKERLGREATVDPGCEDQWFHGRTGLAAGQGGPVEFAAFVIRPSHHRLDQSRLRFDGDEGAFDAGVAIESIERNPVAGLVERVDGDEVATTEVPRRYRAARGDQSLGWNEARLPGSADLETCVLPRLDDLGDDGVLRPVAWPCAPLSAQVALDLAVAQVAEGDRETPGRLDPGEALVDRFLRAPLPVEIDGGVYAQTASRKPLSESLFEESTDVFEVPWRNGVGLDPAPCEVESLRARLPVLGVGDHALGTHPP